MKSMKKSMFVTTILMVVLLIVALSTATFAWYTAQNNAAVTDTTVVSASSSSASLVIDDHVANNTESNSSIDLVMSSNTSAINPIIYNASAEPTSAVDYDTFIASFVTYTITNDQKYASVPTATGATPATIASVDGSSDPVAHDYFYVTNIGGVAANVNANITITADYVISKSLTTADLADGWYSDSTCETPAVASNGKIASAGIYYRQFNNSYLKVAIFVDDNYVYTWSASGQAAKYFNYDASALSGITANVTPTSTHSHSSFSTTAKTSGSAAQIKGNLAAGAAIKVQLVAWFEGDNMTNALAGSGAKFSISFTSTNA